MTSLTPKRMPFVSLLYFCYPFLRKTMHILRRSKICLFVCLFGFLTSSSTTRLYRGRAPKQERLTILRAATHETELGDHDFCLSRSHYTTPTQPVGSGRPQRESNPGPPHQESLALLTQLPRSPKIQEVLKNASLKSTRTRQSTHQYQKAEKDGKKLKK